MTDRFPLRIVAGFWAAAVAVTSIAAWSISHFGVVRPLYKGQWRPMHLLLPWTRWDGGWYQQIATDGYFYDPRRQSSVAFWPTYPLTLRPFVVLGINPYVAGFFVTLAATSVAIVVFAAWQRDNRYAQARLKPGRAAITLSIVAWLAYPYAYYLYGSLYSDALFAAVAITAFWLLERDRPVLAGVVAIAATAGRPFGSAVTVGLALRVLEYRWREVNGEEPTLAALARHPVAALRNLRRVDYGVALSSLGVLSYLGYLWIRFGSPFVFAATEKNWGQGATSSVLLKRAFWPIVLHQWSPSPMFPLTLLAQAAIGIGILTVGTLAVRRHHGLGPAAYVALTIIPPLLFSKDFQGIGRYALAAFPVFAVLGFHLRPHLRLAQVGLVASSACMVLLASLFARGFYLS